MVQSTRAGANYGFEIIWAVLLINLFKYPFFEYGHRFTAATGKSLIEGYRELGKWAVAVFFVATLTTGIVNFAAVALVTTTLGAFFFGIDINSTWLSITLLAAILIMLFIGRYAFLDKFMKFLIIILSIATITAFILALFEGRTLSPDFVPPELWDAAGITFLIALMGWMPTPIEASAWPSLWASERRKQTNYKPKYKEYLIDFHIGYLGSTLLAVFFLGLGALVMYGTGESFAGSSLTFSEKFVSLYANSLGEWSAPFIAGIAFVTIFTTALTVIDGYPRAIEASFFQIYKKAERYTGKLIWLWAVILSILAALIIGVFAERMKAFLDFATIISFLAAPVFAILNYRTVISKSVPKKMRPAIFMRVLSWAGIIFLISFGIIFIYARIWL